MEKFIWLYINLVIQSKVREQVDNRKEMVEFLETTYLTYHEWVIKELENLNRLIMSE